MALRNCCSLRDGYRQDCGNALKQAADGSIEAGSIKHLVKSRVTEAGTHTFQQYERQGTAVALFKSAAASLKFLGICALSYSACLSSTIQMGTAGQLYPVEQRDCKT